MRVEPAAPLAGVRVVVTRASHQAGGLESRLLAAGARVALLPLIELAPPADSRRLEQAASDLHEFDWLVLTSANAVEAVISVRPRPWPSPPAVAAVGHATAAALSGHGVEVALIPSSPRAEGLLEELGPRLRRGQRVLLPQAADARAVLAQGLRHLGMEVRVVEAYRKRRPDLAPQRFAELFGQEPFGWVTFTSPSTARAFAELAAEGWRPRRNELRAASIGPVTSAALRELGVEPAVEADRPGEEALVRGICAEMREAQRLR